MGNDPLASVLFYSVTFSGNVSERHKNVIISSSSFRQLVDIFVLEKINSKVAFLHHFRFFGSLTSFAVRCKILTRPAKQFKFINLTKWV